MGAGASMGAAKTFEQTNYKREYDKAKMASNTDELVQQFLVLCDTYVHFHILGGQPPEDKAKHDEFVAQNISKFQDGTPDGVTNVGDLAEIQWTQPLKLQYHDTNLEMCALIKRCFINDEPQVMKALAPICRALNSKMVYNSQQQGGNLKFPPGGLVYRGSSMPSGQVEFFKSLSSGVKFRLQSYVATSFVRDKAEDFLARSLGASPSNDGVIFIIKVNPDGENDQSKVCRNANLITKRAVGLPDESEYLFTAYSVFRFVDIEISTSPQDPEAPHQITLQAMDDNLDQPPNLPVMGWF